MSKYHTYLNLMDTNLDFIAEFISKRLKNVNKVTTEDVIEAVRLINDEYDDAWAKLPQQTEQPFVYSLLKYLEKYGITKVEDNSFTVGKT